MHPWENPRTASFFVRQQRDGWHFRRGCCWSQFRGRQENRTDNAFRSNRIVQPLQACCLLLLIIYSIISRWTHCIQAMNSIQTFSLTRFYCTFLLDLQSLHQPTKLLWGKLLCFALGSRTTISLREFNDCLDRRGFEKAKSILDELTDLLGEKNTDVVNAKIAYDFESIVL